MQQRRVVVMLAALAALAAAGFGIERWNNSEKDRNTDRLTDEFVDASTQGADGDALSAAARACHDQNLGQGIALGDNDRTMTIDGEGQERQIGGQATAEQISCLLAELGAPDSVTARMDATRALDGMQDAEWGDIKASWTYHPDDGLDIILTVP